MPAEDARHGQRRVLVLDRVVFSRYNAYLLRLPGNNRVIGDIQQGSAILAMAKRMNTSRTALNSLLDPQNKSVTLKTLEQAASALGKKLLIELV